MLQVQPILLLLFYSDNDSKRGHQDSNAPVAHSMRCWGFGHLDRMSLRGGTFRERQGFALCQTSHLFDKASMVSDTALELAEEVDNDFAATYHRPECFIGETSGSESR